MVGEGHVANLHPSHAAADGPMPGSVYLRQPADVPDACGVGAAL